MANVALIIAGGSGNRMHQDIPKQFITVNERPVIRGIPESPRDRRDCRRLHRRLGAGAVGVREAVQHHKTEVRRSRRGERTGVHSQRRI